MNTIYRHIDVCLNRISEGLRVIDEIIRFHLQDEILLKDIKEIRHSVRSFFSISDVELLNCRDSVNDKGFNFSLKSEEKRTDIISIARSSFKRVIESLRVLEEYSKLEEIKKLTNINIEKLRQSIYYYEKTVLLKLESLKKISIITQKIYPITPDFGNSINGNEKLIKYCIEINKVSNFIQLRLKNRSKKELISIISDIKKETNGELEIIINDHLDICISENLLGVHLGQDDLPLSAAKQILGNEKIIGISTHNANQAEKAINGGADYIGIGPIYETKTKNTGYKPLGLKMLKEINNLSLDKNILSFAIGGINKDNIEDVFETNVTGAAIISELREDTVKFYNILLSQQ